MKYLAVEWKTTDPTNPVEMFYEVGDDGWETRKVEAYQDGKLDMADGNHKTGDTWLSPEKMIEIDEINEDSQFAAREITKSEFDEVFQKALLAHGLTRR
jgi:hypothetical protein